MSATAADNIALVRHDLLAPHGTLVVRDGFLYLHASLVEPAVIIVMVADKSWTYTASMRRIHAAFESGIRVVWFVDLVDRNVGVYRSRLDVELYEFADELVGDPELPGFRCPVSAFFSWPEPPTPAPAANP